MNINCIIVDDEPASQKVLEHFIDKVKVLNLIKICSNAQEAFESIQLYTDIQLVFLDINMPNQSGIEFYKSLQNPPKVIFTTAYPQYAVDGFEVNAIDYLLKPIAYQRFLKAINKMIKSEKDNNHVNTSMVINENKTLHKVDFDSIYYVEAFGDYVKVHTKDKTIVTLSTFKAFIAKLPRYFIKSHKSFCVNKHRIIRISGNTIYLEHKAIPIGLSYKNTLIDKL